MNYVQMTAGQDLDTGDLMKIEAEAETRGIIDEDNNVILYGEHAGYKVKLICEITDPVYLVSGDVVDGLDDADVAFSLEVRDPDGNLTRYFPGVHEGGVVWQKES